MTTLRFHARYPVQGSLSEVDGRRPTDFSQTALTLEEDRYTHDREYPNAARGATLLTYRVEEAEVSDLRSTKPWGQEVPQPFVYT